MSGFKPDMWRLLQPSPETTSWEWVREHGRSADGSERYDSRRAPWAEGVCDAFDSGFYRRIVLQWAARMGKTTIRDNLMMMLAREDPQRVLLAGPTEETIRYWIRHKLYKMAEGIPGLREAVPHVGKRSTRYFYYRGGFVRGAWSGSDNMLRDFDARYGFAGELDGWIRESKEEGDSFARFEKRLHGYSNFISFVESTPVERGASLIERLLVGGTNSRFWVPCPKCGHFQVLQLPAEDWNRDRVEKEGGMWFSGDGEPGEASQTATYICAGCKARLVDSDKAKMMGGGIWAARGCKVREGEVIGEPALPQTRFWTSQLSAMYSLDRRWGAIASEWCECHRHASRMRTYINLTGGLAYEFVASKTTEEELAARWCVDRPRSVIPAGASLVTCFVDVQDPSARYQCPWVVLAHGPQERTHLVDWGLAETLGEIRSQILPRAWEHEDGGPELRAGLVLIDSSYRTKEVYDFCRTVRREQQVRILPCKGSSTTLGGKKYQVSRIGATARARRHMTRAAMAAKSDLLILINVDLWEGELQARIDSRIPPEAGSLDIPQEAERDLDFLAQILNATYSEHVSNRGVVSLLWRKKHPEYPNDFRDCVRGAMTAGAICLDERNGRLPPRMPARIHRPPTGMSFATPDGRPFLVTDRDA